ncbi:MAG: DEAD/DEAH box helicase [Candidatus Dormibacteria bacterium]
MPEGYTALLRQLELGRNVSADSSALVEEALAVWAKPGFEIIASLPRLRFEPFRYQLEAAQVALRRMRGRAILADEVGLGKTIEAALVLSELRVRGLARRVLILTPPGLLEQWQEELDRKFALPSLLVHGGSWEPTLWSGEDPAVIASLSAARRAPLKDALVAEAWDLVIVDEAHHLKNPQTASARLLRQLQSRYLLLLTATPVENRLDDLFQLVSLVRPGHLGTPAAFRKRHAGLAGAESAKNLAELQRRTREVMVRHRRSEVARMLPRRLAETLRINPEAAEAELYQLVAERVREQGRDGNAQQAMGLRALLRAAGSSPAALGSAAEAAGWPEVARRAVELRETEKARALLDLLRRHRDRGEKVVVFTGFRRTLEYLQALLDERGLAHAAYHGSLPHQRKEEAIRSFERDLPVLLTTEAGGEGRNLQFCHVMINFDLPWNPMRIEQRLGRIHRVGQDHEVLLSNLVTANTIEDQILRVLESRINLFELVVGELDMILGRIEDDFDFETSIYQAHVQSAHESEFQSRLDTLGEQLAAARTGYLESRSRTDALVGESQSP